MIDDGDRDEKVICVAVKDPRFSEFVDISDLGEHMRKEIAHFYEVYKELQGKHVEVLSWKGAEDAKKVVKEGMELYNNKETRK